MKYFYSGSKITNKKITYGFFTRHKGVSVNNFSSLNCNINSIDNKKNILENIKISEKHINLEKNPIKIINQIHSKKIYEINQNNLLESFNGDGLITKDYNIKLAVLTADCCPIFLFDNEALFIACLHVGWKGVLNNIIAEISKKIIKIQPKFNKINAIVGPCLDQKNFEVSNDFKNKFLISNKNYNVFFKSIDNSQKKLFNMRQLIDFQLKNNKIVNIEHIDLDTYSNHKLFFSHRRSSHLNNLPTGRMINMIGFS